MKRQCVICHKLFTTEDPDVWWCTEECHEEVLARGELNRQLEVEVGAAVREAEPKPQPSMIGVSPAEQARQALGLSNGEGGQRVERLIQEARRDRPKLGSLVVPDAQSTGAECLTAAARLSKLAARMSGAEDACVLIGLARGYLRRAQDTFERALHVATGEEEEEEATDETEAEGGDLRPADLLSQRPGGEEHGPS